MRMKPTNMRARPYAARLVAIAWCVTASVIALPFPDQTSSLITSPEPTQNIDERSYKWGFFIPDPFPPPTLSGLATSGTYNHLLQQLFALGEQGVSTMHWFLAAAADRDSRARMNGLIRHMRDYEDAYEAAASAWVQLRVDEDWGAPAAADGPGSGRKGKHVPGDVVEGDWKWEDVEVKEDEEPPSLLRWNATSKAKRGLRWEDYHIIELYHDLASFYPRIVLAVETVHSLRVNGSSDAANDERVNLIALMGEWDERAREWLLLTWDWVWASRGSRDSS